MQQGHQILFPILKSNRVKKYERKEKNTAGLIYVKPCFKGTIKPSQNHDPFFLLAGAVWESAKQALHWSAFIETFLRKLRLLTW